jgi:hypothetical protein
VGWCCPYVVGRVVAHLPLHSCGTSEVRELGEDAVNCCSGTHEFDAGVRGLAAWAGVDSDVTPSSRRLFRLSTMRPKCARKSASMSGCEMSATTNRHVKSRRNPKLRLSGSRAEVVVDS